jgi:hypothetical protein
MRRGVSEASPGIEKKADYILALKCNQGILRVGVFAGEQKANGFRTRRSACTPGKDAQRPKRKAAGWDDLPLRDWLNRELGGGLTSRTLPLRSQNLRFSGPWHV